MTINEYQRLAQRTADAGDEGADVEAIMAEKCTYNETRPYRHGKKF